MKTIEKIRQKIEELYEGDAPAHDQQCEFEDGYFTGIATISKFLDTLEEPKKDFPTTDNEVSEFLATHNLVEVPDKYKTPDWLFKEEPVFEEPDLDEETIRIEFRTIADKCFNEGIEGWEREKLIARHFYKLGLNARKEEIK